MVENAAVNTVTNASNGIILQVSNLQRMESKRKYQLEETSNQQNRRLGENVRKFIVVFVAEFLGTATLMFLGCMGCIPQVDDPPAVHHLGGLSFGFTVLIIIVCIGHVSAAHLNPAVTTTAMMLRTVSPIMGVNYIVAQFIGGLAGFSLLKVLMPSDYVSGNFCMTLVHPKINVVQAFFIEVCITAVLCTVVSAVWDKRNAQWGDSVAIKFGCAVTLLSMVAGPFTGASMNIARSLPPAIYSNNWKHHWIYWLGPTLGSILGTGIYMLAFSQKKSQQARAPTNDMLPLDTKDWGGRREY